MNFFLEIPHNCYNPITWPLSARLSVWAKKLKCRSNKEDECLPYDHF